MSIAPGVVIGDAVAVIVVRDGRLPLGADDAVAEAGGAAIVVGSGAEAGASSLTGARQTWWSDTGPGLQPGALAAGLARWLRPATLVVLPASPDGRDLAPRLAAALDRPLIARAVRAACHPGDGGGSRRVTAVVARLDDRVLVPVDVAGPAMVTLVPSGGSPAVGAPGGLVAPLPEPAAEGPSSGPGPVDVEVVAVCEPDPESMDLADATRVLAGGAGLVVGDDDARAVEVFATLAGVAAALGASAGATRVVTDAGWAGYERQIGTTGITVDPELYLAFGISGASQHVGGLGNPRHIVSVNTDSSCPMTAMADLGLVTDAEGLLAELARRFGVAHQPGDREGSDG